MKNHHSAPTIKELLVEHNKTHQESHRGEILTYSSNVENDGIYNPTPPFLHGDKLYSAARVDLPGSQEAITQFFSPNGSPTEWHNDPDMPTLTLEDPFTSRVNGQRFFGGVRTYKNSRTGKIEDWDTVIRIVNDLSELHDDKPPDIVGPPGMKGIRPLAIDGELAGLFTRPINERYPRGKVGFLAVKNNVRVTANDLANAPIVEGFIAHEAGEWGGVGEAYYQGEGSVGIWGHLARFVMDKEVAVKEYYGATFSYDMGRRLAYDQQIIACRQCFPETPAKNPEVKEVFYLGGVSAEDGKGYGGVSDYTVGRLAVGEALAQIAA